MTSNAFWGDLASDLSDPEVRRAYVAETAFITAIEAAINAEASALGEEVSGDGRCSS